MSKEQVRLLQQRDTQGTERQIKQRYYEESSRQIDKYDQASKEGKDAEKRKDRTKISHNYATNKRTLPTNDHTPQTDIPFFLRISYVKEHRYQTLRVMTPSNFLEARLLTHQFHLPVW